MQPLKLKGPGFLSREGLRWPEVGGDTGSLKQSVINESLLPPSVCGIFLFLREIINMKWRGLFYRIVANISVFTSFDCFSEWRRILMRPGDNEQNSLHDRDEDVRSHACVEIKILSIVKCGWPAEAEECDNCVFIVFSQLSVNCQSQCVQIYLW